MKEREREINIRSWRKNSLPMWTRTLEDLTPTSRKAGRAAGPFETGSREGNRIQWDAIVIYSPRCDCPPCPGRPTWPRLFIKSVPPPNRTAVCVVLGINEERVASLRNSKRNSFISKGEKLKIDRDTVPINYRASLFAFQ